MTKEAREKQQRADAHANALRMRESGARGPGTRTSRLKRGEDPAAAGDIPSLTRTAIEAGTEDIVDRFRFLFDDDYGARQRLLAALQMPRSTLHREYDARACVVR